jgi:hypothetical protein
VKYCDVSATVTDGVATVTATNCEDGIDTALRGIVSGNATHNIEYEVAS